MSPFFAALTLTVFAGLATGLGGLAVLPARRPSPRLLAAGLGLSAGVMLYVSFVELLPQGTGMLTGESPHGTWIALASFFGGIALIGFIDRLVPEEVNPHEALAEHEDEEGFRRRARIMRVGVLTSLVIVVHNVPEGFATLVSGLDDPALGVGIALAVAIHNIPEGSAIAIPVHAATGSRARGIIAATLSGLAEPVGALLLYVLLLPVLSPVVLGVVFAAVAGIMVFVSLDVLLPTAERYGEHHATTYALVAGMAVMAVSLELIAALG